VPLLARSAHADLMALKQLVDAGKLVPAIERRYPLERAGEAVRCLGARGVRGKLVITVP
jgi:NADPH:quinone reductase-like Zn-dependent oxidoreductase